MTHTRSSVSAFLFVALLTLLGLAIACEPEEDVPGSVTTTPFATPSQTAAPTTPSNCPTPSGTAPEVQMKTYEKPPLTIDTAKKYTAVVKTERGDITIELRPDLAPEHVNGFVFLAREKFYDGVTFHRVIPGFVAQAGDPTGSGSGGPGYMLPAEFTTAEKFERGTLGMARAGSPDSGGSQWFINYAATPSLDGQYTIFGKVTAGMEVVDCITPRDPSGGGNLRPGDKIITIEITES